MFSTMLCQAQDMSVEIFESTKNSKFAPLGVYDIASPDGGTVVRKKPNGKEIFTLDLEEYYVFTITKIKGDWFKLIQISSVEGTEVKIPSKNAWIHYSNIEAGTRKDVTLLSAPVDGKVVGTIGLENGVGIIDVYDDWVKIQLNEQIGWIEREWLCESPVTTCP